MPLEIEFKEAERPLSDTFFQVAKFYVLCLILAILLYNVARRAEEKAERRGIAKGRAQYWDAFPKGKHIPVEQPAKEESNG